MSLAYYSVNMNIGVLFRQEAILRGDIDAIAWRGSHSRTCGIVLWKRRHRGILFEFSFLGLSSVKCIEEYADPCDENGIANKIVNLGSSLVSIKVICDENHDYTSNIKKEHSCQTNCGPEYLCSQTARFF
jgi:hypothetical protein